MSISFILLLGVFIIIISKLPFLSSFNRFSVKSFVMLIDEEYPATHSMSTSWYIVDEEGNVGIMDFNANGPVPWGTEETVSEDLIWGLDSDKVDLTEEQILYALGESYTPEEVDDYSDCIIQIDKSRKELFESLCKELNISLEDIKSGLRNFKATKMRLDIII